MNEKVWGEIQHMFEAKLAEVRADLKSSEGGLFWRPDEDDKRLARVAHLQELERELVAMLTATYEDTEPPPAFDPDEPDPRDLQMQAAFEDGRDFELERQWREDQDRRFRE